MNQPANRRQIATDLRAVEALRLRAQGQTFAQIGLALGIHKSNVKRQTDRLLAEVQFDAVEDYRQLMLAELEAVKARVLEIFYADHVHVADGRVVRENGVAVLDHGPNLAAAREFRQISERIAKLTGADAPTRKVVEVITTDVIDAAIQAELHAMEALDADTAAAGRSPAGEAVPPA